MHSVKKLFDANFKYVIQATRFTSYFPNSCTILGIESSCDDTGSAVVTSDGKILGEALQSQEKIHVQYGGIIPPIAEDMHRKNMETVVNSAVSKVDFKAIDAIAVTTKPGLPLSLNIGTKYAKFLCRLHKKPLIPIHHMEAHALMPRMTSTLDFPFLILLLSGAHCLLAVAQSADKFFLLGESIDDAPGEAFDKIARRLKLKNLPEFAHMSGGRAIEIVASRASDLSQFPADTPMLQYRDCQFSFAGLKNVITRHIIKEEQDNGLAPDEIIPSACNLAATFQFAMTRHLCHRLQRAMEFCEMRALIPSANKQLVVSGGVACNNFLCEGLKIVADEMGYAFHRPPPKLCTDNGVMIAWNGVEKWQIGKDITMDYNSVQVEKSSPLGINIIPQVRDAALRCKWVKLTKLTNHPQDSSKQAIIENI